MDSRISLLRSVVIAATMSLAALGAESIQRVTGVLYGSDGGLVASAAGRFSICADGRLLTLHYRGSKYKQPLSKSGFTDPNSEDVGAVWTVWFHGTKENGRERLQLDRARFLGRFDNGVRMADQTVRMFFTLLAQRKYRAAYDLLSQNIRVKTQLDGLIAQLRSVDFSSYLEFGANVTCTSVKSVRKGSIRVSVDMACFEAGNPSSVIFELRPSPKKYDKWLIDVIDPLVGIF